jgi:hypothetical protein
VFLAPEDIRTLTSKRKPSAQARALDFMRIPYRLRPDKSLVVLRIHLESTMMDESPRPEPRLRLS